MDETRPAARAKPARARPRSAAAATYYSATGQRVTCRALIKTDERKMRIHHARLQSAKALVSTRAHERTQNRTNPKRRQAERERQADIARQNRHLVDRCAGARAPATTTNPDDASAPRRPPPPLLRARGPRTARR